MGLRPTTRRLLLGLGAFASSLLLLELGARLAGSTGLGPSGAELATRLDEVLAAPAGGPADAAGRLTNNLVIHPFLGFAVDPDLARADGFPNGPVSELGFVGADPLAPTPPGTARVAVLGGSFASQLCNRTREPLLRALAGRPEIAGRPILLDCLAIGSARQPQQLMTLAWVASLGTRYDLVLNIDGFNDIVLALTYNHRKGIFRGYPAGLGSTRRRPARSCGPTRHRPAGLGRRTAPTLGPTSGSAGRGVGRGAAGVERLRSAAESRPGTARARARRPRRAPPMGARR